MEHSIVIRKEMGFYMGYGDGRYLEGSCAYTKWGCKRNIKKYYTRKDNIVSTYKLKA